jgi:tetratricopeptide (TPR) repeat protein
MTVREFLQMALQDIEELGDEPEVQTEFLETFSEVYVDLGLYKEAQLQLEQALETRQRQFPGNSMIVARTLNDLGAILYRQEQFGKAEHYYRQALAMRRELGQTNEALAKVMSNLASSLMDQGKYQEAEALYRDALDNRLRTLPADDPDIGTSLRSLGTLYYLEGRYEEAEPLLRHALTVRRVYSQKKPSQVAAALSSLGRLLQARGRYEEADANLSEALELRQVLYRSDHLLLALSRLDMAALLLEVGEYETAGVLLGQALPILQRTEPAKSWNLSRAESLLGAWYQTQGRPAWAEPCLREGYLVLRERRGETDRITRTAEDRYRRFLEGQGRGAEMVTNRPPGSQGASGSASTVHRYSPARPSTRKK